MGNPTVEFFKYCVNGRSAIVIGDLKNRQLRWERIASGLLDTHLGIGGGRLVVVRPSRTRDFQVLEYKQDGSLSMVNVRALQCATRFLVDRKHISLSKKSIEFEGAESVVTASYTQEGRVVRVVLDKPSFGRQEPGDEADSSGRSVTVDGARCPVMLVEIERPHYVVFLTKIDHCVAVSVLDELKGKSWYSPQGSLVVATREDEGKIVVQEWVSDACLQESSMTGACAAVVAGARWGKCYRDTEARPP